MMHPISPDRFDAVLFDLDGVLTATAKVHAACWKRLFDEFLEERAAAMGEPLKPFDIVEDYKLYVDVITSYSIHYTKLYDRRF